MTVPLPSPLPTSAGWRAVDKIDHQTSGTADASGTATVDLGTLDTQTRWVLTHMVAACTSAAASTMRLYFGSVGPAGLRDGTSAGNFDVADWSPGLFVPEGTRLLAVWSGADPGALATLTLQADVYRRS